MKTRAAWLLILAAMCVGVSAQKASKPHAGQVTVFVTGAVRKPGICTLAEDATILDAIAAAGNVTDDAELSRVRLIQNDGEGKPTETIVNVKKEVKNGSKLTSLCEGDTLAVSKRFGSRMF